MLEAYKAEGALRYDDSHNDYAEDGDEALSGVSEEDENHQRGGSEDKHFEGKRVIGGIEGGGHEDDQGRHRHVGKHPGLGYLVLALIADIADCGDDDKQHQHAGNNKAVVHFAVAHPSPAGDLSCEIVLPDARVK